MFKIDWEAKYNQLEALFLQLQAENAKLKNEIQKLRAKNDTNSNNSSLPPSQDPHRSKRKVKVSGKSPGGQPGHAGHKRKLYPQEALSANIDVKPKICPTCHSTEFDAIVSVECRQVIELPDIKPDVTQYNIHTCLCNDCGSRVQADIPREAQRGFGPRLMGFLTMLSGDIGVTKRKICSLAAHLGMHISLGALCNIHRLASNLLSKPAEEIRQFVLQGKHVNADETSWQTFYEKRWAWIGVGEDAAFLKIDTSRSQKAFSRVFGSFQQTLTCDRYGAYNIHNGNKQTCLAHIARDFEKISMRDGFEKELGKILAKELRQIFILWGEFKDGTHTLQEMQKLMAMPIDTMKYFLELGATLQKISKKTQRFCKNILKRFSSLWTFLKEEGVEPTNNRAERGLRPLVIMRKLSGSTQSEWGERFRERIFTVTYTLKKRAHNVFKYLNEVFEANILAVAIPSAIAQPP